MEENNQDVITSTSIPTEVQKIYTFRKLSAKDIPTMLNVLKKIQISQFADCFQSERVQNLIKKANAEGQTEGLDVVAGSAVFLEIAQVLINGIADCGDEIFKLLSETSNLTIDEVKELDFEVFTEMVIDFIKKEEFVGFIKAVSKFLK